MANARLQIVVDGDNEDAKRALEQIGKALGDLDKQTDESSKKQDDFWNNLSSIAAGGVIANGIGAVAEGIGGIVSGMMDVSAAASDARTILGGLASDVDMTALLNDANLLSTRFGVDTADTVAAAKTLMSEFGISGDEAMNIIISGMEGGLNASGDFLDSIGEYSNLMSDNGFSAEEFFSIMETGMAGGALGTDKAADAFKEFGIRIQEMGDDVWGPEGILRTSMGMTDEEISALYDGMSDGSISVADAYQQLIPQLAAIENPIYRNTAGVALFGTQWEDLGASAILGIDMANTSMDDMAARAEVSRTTIASLGEIGPLAMGKIATALLPVNDGLIAMVNAFLNSGDPVQAFIDSLAAAGWGDIAAGISQVRDVLAPTFSWIVENKEGIIAGITGIAAVFVGAAIPGMVASLNALAVAGWAAIAPMLPLIAGAAAVGAVAFVVAENWDELSATFVEAGGGLAGIGAAILKLGSIIWDFIDESLGDLDERFADWAVSMWSWITDSIAGVGTALANWWKSITDWFAAAPNAIKGTVEALGLAIIDGIQAGVRAGIDGLTAAISSAIGSAVAWVKALLGIRSPSTVFRDEVGAQMGAGMAEGMINSMGQVRAAGLAVSAAALMGAGRGTAAMLAQSSSPAINNYYNYSPVYSAVPSRPSADFALMQSLARTI